MEQTPEKLIEAARQAQNAYQREYRSRNREKVREWNHSYWVRRAAKLAEEERREQRGE